MSNLQAQPKGGVPATAAHAPGILKSDMIIPYIILGQGLSDAVKDRKVQLGDIYRSTSQEILGNPDKPITAIFLHAPRADWVIEEKPKGANRFEYRRSEPRTASNETQPWSFFCDAEGSEFKAPGVAYTAQDKGVTEWRRVKRLTAFAILPQDIEAYVAEMEKDDGLPDPNKALSPVAFSFRSTSYQAGKEIGMFIAKAASMKTKKYPNGAPPYMYTLPLSCKLEQNDQGSFYVWSVNDSKAGPVTPKQLEYMQEWIQMINQGTNLQVHEEAEQQAYSAPTSGPVESEVC